MALEFTYCKVWKWIDIDWSELFNFYGKDFNPNVPSVPGWDTAWVTDQTSTFNLSWFQPWHEVWCCVAIFKNNDADNSRTQHLYADFYQGTSGTPSWTYDAGNITVPAWWEWMMYAYFWVDDDEIRSWYSSYKVRWQMNDGAISTTFSVSGLSIDATLHTAWQMWVDGTHLCYVDGTHWTRWYKHSIAYDSWYSEAVGSSHAGYIRLSDVNALSIYYVDEFGTKRRTYNSDVRYWGSQSVSSSKAGYMRVSDWNTQNWYWHLCFINKNGNKRRILNWPPAWYT